ncbi:hypothetical protein [Streptomyces liliifuscus]|uniref:Uncharacterized protein n=1 Tax=Streptomyces liliifuscus TaxID=2797636 RepID=A0A7T7RFS0_9ACTN|nr:hypothetical protein [Streptomyces liliifuscus]QQM44984.1 hypothetical protein JEQ17_40005 [Streptomyces liliifuscus]
MPHPSPRPSPRNGPGNCPRCLEAVIWCVTDANRVTQAVDPKPDPAGNQAVRIDRVGRYLVRQLSNDRPSLEGSEKLHKPHVATCPVPAPKPAAKRLSATKVRAGVRPVRWQR